MPSFPPPPSPSVAGFSSQGRSTNGTSSSGGHQRHQSTSSLSPHSTMINHNYQQPSRERRVWVKRPQGTPTTIKVSDGDIVDDLKTMVILKYPTTLARTCDPADVNFTFVRDGKTITLLPDEVVFKFLDRYFPSGMNMQDALVLEQVPTVALAASTTASAPFITTTLEPTYTSHLSTVAEAPIREATAFEQPNFAASYANHPKTHNSISSGGAQSPRPPLFHQTSSYGSASSVKTSSPNNGVLLLPRQFQLPKGSPGTDEKNDSSRRRSADDGNGEEQPGGISIVDEDAATARLNAALAKEESSSNEKLLHSPTKERPNATSNSINVTEGQLNATGPGKPGGNQKNIETVVPQINMLIVEDNVINQKILEQFMKRKKIRSSVAKNGREAVDKWRQGGFHLILMDIQLPVMSGIEATKEIRRLELVNKIGVFSQHTAVPSPSKEDLLDLKVFRSPVIIVALTASSTMMDKNEALAAGCNDFLTKPVNLQWLNQKTIEWGCMQALIDFEGWKNWVDRDGKVNSTTTTTTTTTTGSLGTALTSHRPRSRSRSRSNSRSRNSIKRVGSGGGSSGKSPLNKEITAPNALTPISPVLAKP